MPFWPLWYSFGTLRYNFGTQRYNSGLRDATMASRRNSGLKTQLWPQRPISGLRDATLASETQMQFQGHNYGFRDVPNPVFFLPCYEKNIWRRNFMKKNLLKKFLWKTFSEGIYNKTDTLMKWESFLPSVNSKFNAILQRVLCIFSVKIR